MGGCGKDKNRKESKPRNYQTIYELSVEDWNKLDASRVSSSLQTIRDKLKIIEATARDSILKQELFSFEDFEKDYILNNPLFRQRSSIKRVALSTEYLFDRTLYEHRFLFSKKATLKQDVYWPFIYTTLINFCKSTGLVQQSPIKHLTILFSSSEGM